MLFYVFYILATALWLIVTVVNWLHDNRKLPVFIGSTGLLLHAGIWLFGIGLWGFAGLGILIIIGMFAVPDVFLGGKR